MGKRYGSVTEMVNEIIEDDDFCREFERASADRTLSATLFAMRCKQGLTQAELAKRMGCAQSRISKLENAGTAGVRVSDLVAYAQALGLQLSVGFLSEMNAAERVKYHALEIKRSLDHLAELAHEDSAIFEGVKKFYAEYLENVVRLFEDSVDRLPGETGEAPGRLEVRTPSEGIDNEAVIAK
jgi:transcriptional regulator with XRE-family HTH domain